MRKSSLLIVSFLLAVTFMPHETNAAPQSDDVKSAAKIISAANRQMNSGMVLGVDEQFSQAVAMLEKHQPAERKLLVDALTGLGKSYSQAGKAQESTPLLERAAKLCLDSYGKDSPQYADICYCLGLNYAVTGDTNKSVTFLETSAHIFEKTGNRSQLIRNLFDLSDIYGAVGRKKEAETALRKAESLEKQK